MKILIIRYSSLGDLVLLTAATAAIKKLLPEAEIHILTKKEFGPVFENNPDVDKVIYSFSRKIKYDYLLDLHANLRSTIRKFFIPAKKLLTYDKASTARRVFLHSGLMQDTLNKTVIERYIQPLIEEGYELEPCPPKIVISPEESARAAQMAPKKPYIAFVPGARWPTKEWSPEKFISLAVQCIKNLGKNILILGGPGEEKLAETIYFGTGILRKYVVNLAGKTNLREYFALIDSSSAILVPDSAALHIAWATKTPAVALFGPTVKEFGFQPVDEKVVILEKDMECRPCSLHGSKKCKFRDQACLQRIEVNEVFNELRKFTE